AEVRDFAYRGRQAVVDDNQIVVCIQRQLIGIKGPFGLSRRFQQLLRKRARDKPGGRSNSDSAKKGSPRANRATGKFHIDALQAWNGLSTFAKRQDTRLNTERLQKIRPALRFFAGYSSPDGPYIPGTGMLFSRR